MFHPWQHLVTNPSAKMKCLAEKLLTSSSFGGFLASGSFNKHASTNSSAALGNLPSGVNLGAGSLTICCSNSKILIVLDPPWRLTPMLFRFLFLSSLDFFCPVEGLNRGLPGDKVP